MEGQQSLSICEVDDVVVRAPDYRVTYDRPAEVSLCGAIVSAARMRRDGKELARREGEGAILGARAVCARLRRVPQLRGAFERSTVPEHLLMRAAALAAQSKPALIGRMQRLCMRAPLGNALRDRKRHLGEGVARGRRRRRRLDERKAGRGFSLRRARDGDVLTCGGWGVLVRTRGRERTGHPLRSELPTLPVPRGQVARHASGV